MKLKPEDMGIVTAFLEREAKDYRWKDEVQGPKDFIVKQLINIETEMAKYPKGANFAVLHSLTNMGQTQRSIALTPEPWCWEERDINFYLGTTPRDGVGSSRQAQGIVDVIETCCEQGSK